MRNLALLCCVVLVLAGSALAQTAEFSGGYSHLTGAVGKDGFDLAAYLASKHLGLEGDGGGYFASLHPGSDNVYTFAGGPRVVLTKRYELFTPFVHVLFGGAHEFSTYYFAVLGGAGVDIGTKKFGARVKLDAVHFNNDTHARATLGLVLRR
jgi:hypothetical protein